MGKLEATLKYEISRLARKEIKSAMTGLEKRLREMQSRVRALQTEQARLTKQIAKLRANTVQNEQAAAKTKPEASPASRVRMTPILMKKFRARNELTQSQLARLMGVSMGAITGWEKGATSPRDRNRERFGEIRSLSKAQIHDQLGIKDKKTRRPRIAPKTAPASPADK